MGNRNAKVHMERPTSAGIVSPRTSMTSPRTGQTGTPQWIDDTVRKVVERKDWKALQKMLQNHPEWVSVPQADATKPTPAHRALIEHAPCYILETIVSIDVLQAVKPDLNGTYLIHYAAQRQSSFAVFQLIMRFDTKASERLDKQGLLAIHYAAKYHPPIEAVEALIKANPAGPRAKSPKGELPLHVAAETRAPSAIIEMLVKAYPEGVRAIHQANLPLHFACKCKPSATTVKCLLEAYPDGINVPGEKEMFPLHLAIANKCSYEVAMTLIQANVENLLIRDKSYRMPLHHALETGCSSEAILYMLKQCPDVAKHRGRGTPGDLPLAMAVEHGFACEVVLGILYAYPLAITVKTVQNMHILRNAIRRKLDIDSIVGLIDAFPDAASEVDEHGRVALHYAASRLYPCKLVDTLIRAYPLGVSCVDNTGQVPLHLLALRAAANIQIQEQSVYKNFLAILNLFLERYPHAVCLQDKHFLTPLNYLIENNSPIELYQLLIAADGKCLSAVGDCGKLPLHHAIECKRSHDIIQLLVASFPEGATIRNKKFDDQLALHQAIVRPLPISSLLLIEESFPAAASQSDNSGLLPIHHCLHMKTDLSLVKRLLFTNSAAVHDIVAEMPVGSTDCVEDDIEDAVDGDSHDHTENSRKYIDCCKETRLLHLAVACDCAADVVAEILQYTMPFKPNTAELNLAHYFTWTHLIAHTGDKYWHSVELLLDLYAQDVIYKLSQFPDARTRKALDIATPRCRDVIVHRLHYFSRYELHALVIHRTDCSMLKSAVDHCNGSKLPVVLKFSSCLEGFQNEVRIREALQLFKSSKSIRDEDQFVLPVVAFANADEDYNYRNEAALKGFKLHNYLIVTAAARRCLADIIRQDNIAGKDLPAVVEYAKQLLEALQYLHNAGIVHGNLHAGHIFDYHDRLVVGDFSFACSLIDEDRVKTSAMQRALSCASPEIAALYLTERRPGQKQANPPQELHEQMAATIAMDMWSVGAVIYEICTGEPLFLVNCHNDIDYDQVEMLSKWPEFAKKKRMQRIPFPVARNLVDQLLSADPAMRPDATYCLQHPLFKPSGTIIRFPGMDAEYDMFISFRNSATDKDARMMGKMRLLPDHHHVDIFVDKLNAQHFTTHISSEDSLSAETEHFEQALSDISRSKAMGIVLSRYAVNCDTFSIGTLERSSPLSIFLFELRIAMELRARGLLEHGVYIIAIGDTSPPPDQPEAPDSDDEDSYAYDPFFHHHEKEMTSKASGCLPDRIPGVVVKELEDTARSIFHAQGLGKLLFPEVSVRDLFNYLLELPTFHVLGKRAEAFHTTSQDIMNVLLQQRGDPVRRNSSISSRPTTSAVFQRMLSGRIPTPEINSRVPTNWLKDREPMVVPPSPLHELSITDLLVSHQPQSLSMPSSPIKPTTAGKPLSQQRSRRNMDIIPEQARSVAFFPSNQRDDEEGDNDIQFINNNSVAVVHSNSWKAPQLNMSASMSELPFFTEIAHVDKSKTEMTLQFLWEKMEVRETEISNMKIELSLMEERTRLQQLEIQRLRGLVRITDPRTVGNA